MVKHKLTSRALSRRRHAPAALFAALLLSTFSIVLQCPAAVSAATPGTVNFQARLQSAEGAIVPDGNYNVEFQLLSGCTSEPSSNSGCSVVWTEDYLNSNDQGLQVVNGYVSTGLGSVNPFPATIDWSQRLWLAMDVGGTGSSITQGYASDPSGWDGPMSPYLSVTASPYAFQAGEAAQATELSTTANGNTSTLSLQASGPGDGNQTFVIQDQGAAGTYDLLTTQAADSAFIQLQSETPAQQSGALDISGVATVGSIVTSTLDTASSGSISIGGTHATSISLGSTTTNIATTINGTAIVQPTTGHNSTTAFEVQNSAGTNVFNVDTTNGIIGTAATSAASANSSALTLQSGSASGSGSNSGTVTLDAGSSTSGSAGSVNLGTANTPTVNIGSTGSTSKGTAVHIGDTSSSTNAQTVTVGSAASNIGDTTLIQGGNNTTQAIQIIPNSAGGITVGGASETGTVTVGESTASNTISIGSAVTGSGNTQTINIGSGATTAGTVDVNIGNGATSGGVDNITLGGSIGTSATTIQAGTGGLSLQTGATSSGNSGSIVIESGNASSGTSGNVIIDTGAGSVTTGANLEHDTFEGTGSGSTDSWASGYNTTTPTPSTTYAKAGSYSLAFTTTNAAWAMNGPYPGSAVTPDNLYNFSIWIRGTSAGAVDFYAEWLTASSQTAQLITSISAATTGGWTELSGNLTAPAGATNVWLALVGTTASGNAVYMDEALVKGGADSPIVGIGTTNAAAVVIGNTDAAGQTLIQGGTEGVDITTAAGNNVAIGTDNASLVTLGDSAGSEPLTMQGEGISDTITGSSGSTASDVIETSTNSTTAFEIQNASGASGVLFTADTSDSIIDVSGTTSTFATLELSNGHFESTQATAPTIGTPASCGSSPTAAVTSGSTDMAGSFTITAGSGSPTTCQTVVTFQKPYGSAPKSISLTPTVAVGGAAAPVAAEVYSVGTNSFTVQIAPTNAAPSTKYSFYYIVIQ